MTEELVSFETAKLAKEKGFDEECMHYWEWYEWKPAMQPVAHAKPIMDFREVDFGLVKQAQERPGLFNKIYQPMRNSTTNQWLYARPTQDLLERWLREKHGIDISLERDDRNNRVFMKLISTEHSLGMDDYGYYTSHDHAREAALIRALKLIP